MTDRDPVYVQILHFAVTQIRDTGRAGLTSYCAIEMDHIHNLPSLIGEPNDRRHLYYFNIERTEYLERVDRTLPHVQFLLRRYAELWNGLDSLKSTTPMDDGP